MTDTEYKAEQRKFQIETQQQIRKIYALIASAEEQRAEETKQRAKERTEETKQRAKERAEETKQRAKERAEETKQRAKERAEETKQRAKERAEETKQRAKQRTEEEKLAKERDKKTEKIIQEAWAAIRAANKTQNETTKIAKATKEKLKEVSEDISRLNKQCGGIGNNIGSVTEEFFFKAISAHMRIGTVVFDTIESSARYKSVDGTDTGELDLVLFNGIFALVIETKYRCHYNDVLDFEDKMSKIQLHAFEEFGAKQLLFGMASEKFNEDAAKYAQKCNMILLYPDGQTIRADTDACTALKP